MLINFVMVRFMERDLIQAKLETGRQLLHVLRQKAVQRSVNTEKAEAELNPDNILTRDVMQLLRVSGFSGFLMVNRAGEEILSQGTLGEAKGMALLSSRETLANKKANFDLHGKTWGVIWPAYDSVIMSSPLFSNGQLTGAVTIHGNLASLYQSLRKSERLILIYAIINTIILALFGTYLLSRTFVKPIHKLLRITEEFKEGEPFPYLVHSSRNEIGRLFRSLNMMVNRLEENKKELKAHISSLEQANKEIQKAQEEIIKTEKLASIGRLSTGLAHEIGNPIGIILGYLGLLKRKDLEESEREDFLNRTETEISRINEIIRQLLDYSRPSSAEPEATGVHKLIQETLDMLSPQPMMSRLKTKIGLDAAADTVWANPNQLKQVFLNVIMNAADAMDATDDSVKKSRKRILTIRTANPEKSIELVFEDTGPGIAPDDLGRIFDPFYTTKDPGKGTGLGLSICYRIIEGLGGNIRAESRPGQGTSIIIDIPLYQMKNKKTG
jgi:two-component system NtrC family sensor kinase